MARPMHIEVRLNGSLARVTVIVPHAMDAGGSDARGRVRPPWFVQEISATWNGRSVLSAQWGPMMADNPVLQFSVRGAKAGDTLELHWVDNRGEQRSDKVSVA